MKLSISVKFLGAFLTMTLIAVGLGIHSLVTLTGMSKLAVETFDKPLMASSFARAAAYDVEVLKASFGKNSSSSIAPKKAQQTELRGVGILTAGMTQSIAPSKGVMSERQKLIEIAKMAQPTSERQRLIKSARKANASKRSKTQNDRRRATISERKRLLHIAQKGSPKSERQKLIIRANERAKFSQQVSPAKRAGLFHPEQKQSVRVVQHRVVFARGATNASKPVSRLLITHSASNKPSAGDKETLRKAIVEQYEQLISDLEVVEERAFTPEIEKHVSSILGLANQWGEANKAILEGKGNGGFVKQDVFNAIGTKIQALVEQTVVDGFAYRTRAEMIVAQEKKILWAMLILSFVVGLVLTFISSKFIVVPLKNAIKALTNLASGDLSVDLKVTSKDEIGELVKAVYILRENMKERAELRNSMAAEEDKQKAARKEMIAEFVERFQAQFEQSIEHIVVNMDELKSTANTLNSIAGQTSNLAGDATSSTEQTSDNVQAVASASQELSASIGEINTKLGHATGLVGTAVDRANESNSQVTGLTNAAQKIGEVIVLIRDVAEQTNLLALNATIEAARAGDAGKGFAVVATEVKSLAGQTAKATDEISQQVDAIQKSTEDVVGTINNVTDAVEQVRTYTSEIAAAVEQQSSATGEIAQSADKAATGTTQASDNMAELTKSAGETSHSANAVLGASEKAANDANGLKDSVNTLLKDLTAA